MLGLWIVMTAAQATGATPQNNPGEWVQTSDYPSPSLRNEEEGAVGFRLTISPDGAVSDCFITSSSGFATLDETTCNLMKLRARFNPAKDAEGKATIGAYSSRVRWKIPNDVDENAQMGAPQAGVFGFSFFVEKDGTQTDCRVVQQRGAIGSGPPTCPKRKFTPYRNSKGQLVRKRVTITTRIAVDNAKDR